MNNKNISESGQALLSLVLIATVLATIGLAIVQSTQQSIKTTKLEQDQKKALAAAEAGIDAAIKLPSGSSFGLETLNLDETISGNVLVDNTVSSSFTTQLLVKDKQQTFYLASYDLTNNSFTDEFSGDLTITLVKPTGDYCSGDNKFALEVSFLHQTNGLIGRKVIDECNPATISGTVDKLTSFPTTITAPAASHLLLLRIIAVSNNLTGVELTINRVSGDWPLQGKTIISTAATNTGVSKKIHFFQSYPQLQSELFVTSF